MTDTPTEIAESVLAEMEARVNAVTPGPWRTDRSPYEGWKQIGGSFLGRIVNAKGVRIYEGPSSFHSLNGDANAEFIASCRTDNPALIAEVRRLSRLSLYDPRTHVCVEREDIQRLLATVDMAFISPNSDEENDAIDSTMESLARWLSTPESK